MLSMCALGRGAHSKCVFRMRCFCPPELVLPQHFLKIVIEVKASESPHVLKLWLGVSKGMLNVKYFRSTKPLYVSVEFHGYIKTVTRLR